MDHDNHQQFISNSINRLIDENCIQINFNETIKNNLEMNIEIIEPQWYIDINEKDKEIIFSNLQSHYLKKINEIKFEEVLIDK